jgi:hypothetical protein
VQKKKRYNKLKDCPGRREEKRGEEKERQEKRAEAETCNQGFVRTDRVDIS